MKKSHNHLKSPGITFRPYIKKLKSQNKFCIRSIDSDLLITRKTCHVMIFLEKVPVIVFWI
jgi:hypothetical protein